MLSAVLSGILVLFTRKFLSVSCLFLYRMIDRLVAFINGRPASQRRLVEFVEFILGTLLNQAVAFIGQFDLDGVHFFTPHRLLYKVVLESRRVETSRTLERLDGVFRIL